MRLFYAVGLDEPVKNALCSAMERMRSCCMKGSAAEAFRCQRCNE